MLASLVLLGAGVGCLSMEPISSYSSGQPEVAEVATPLEPPPTDSASESTEGAAPPDEQVIEGLPGDGEVALDPGEDSGEEPGTSSEMAPGSAEEEPPAASCAATGEFASSDGTSCYRSSTQNAAWTDALASCESWGGSLVNIGSPAEDAFLSTRMSTTFWIAASDRAQEGRMFWSGGTPVEFANWSPGQPDDFQGREDCVVKISPAGTWNDRPCGNVIPYVCERSQE
jgi:hypothetical protein